jgi:uncharacterized protein (TIGR02145 family)
MKKKRLSHFLFLLLLCLIIATTCKKLEKSMLVSTGDVTNISTNSADASGDIIDLGNGITQHGHCYAKTPNVTISSTKTDLGVPSGNGGFTSQLKNLEAGTLYYIKAYVSDGTETVYGKEKSFTTNAAALPTITTTTVTFITTTTATSGGTISGDGGAPISVRGICWHTATGPSVINSKTTDGTGTGNFTSSLTGLTPGTIYYVRAYATNIVGTAYGNEVSFTATSLLLPIISTTAITGITQTTANAGGTITSDGGAAISVRGVCWNTSTGPSISNSKTTDGAGSGGFSSSITGLSANTKYYVRAYATNSVGTAYGDEVSFTTSAAAAVVPTLTTAAINGNTQTGATSGGNITSDGGAAITSKGVCWNTSQNPTIADNKTIDGTGTGSFTSSLSGLTPGTIYYVRAYATNSIGTAYGNELTFTTSAVASVIPTLTTNTISAIAQTTATSGGNITSDGGAAVISKGVCWSTIQNPTIADSKTIDGTGTETFTSNLTGLTLNTIYYVRAYATNSIGTAYGDQLIFKTLMAIPVSGLLAYYPFNGNANDESGGNNNGIVYGATLTKDLNGNPNSAYYFDGTGNYIQIPMVNWPAFGTGDFAVCAWVNPLSFNDFLMILTDDVLNNFQFNFNPGGGSIGFYLPGTGFTSDSYSFTISTWYHLVGMRQNGFLKFYVNGQAYGSFISNESISKSSFIDIGFRTSNMAHPFHGSIDQVQIYNRSLTLTEIQQFYQGPPFVTTSPISAMTSTTAVSGGNVTFERGTSVTARGVCWSTSANPTIADAKTTDGTGSGVFTSNITGLLAGTSYHVRAYATNSFGTAYGEDKTFITLKPPSASTLAATNVKASTATFNGTVNAYNSLTAVSFEYGLTTSYGSTIGALQSPVTGSTSTSVSTNISGLSANTTYHFRVIAASDGGTTNGNDISFTTTSGTVGDVDGNVYNTVIIGTQTWMAENLKTTKYNDGTSISLVTDGTAWTNLSTQGFSWYNNDAATNKDLYGALYNWYSVITGKLCPAGWHVPTDTEWTILTTWLGGETVAGGKLKETGTTHWTTPNTGATNESGFTALPGGYRSSTGPFANIGINGSWWSSTEQSPSSAWYRYMYNNFSEVSRPSTLKQNGMSVRCIKD